MANNLHISYDLMEPGKNYDRVIDAIKRLGGWAKIHYSYWYVDSPYTAGQARDLIVKALDVNDKLYVVNATTNDAAWHNLSDESGRFIQQHWRARAA